MNLLQAWLRHYDPIHRGWTPAGIANAVCATNGFAFPRVAGGYNLYRGLNADPHPGADQPVGAAGARATVIDTFAWRPGPASNAGTFALVAIGGGGVESALGNPLITVEFDSERVPQPPVPNPPRDLSAWPIAGGRFRLTWHYAERDQAVAPMRFEAYRGDSADAIDFDTPIAGVSYRPRRVEHQCATPAYAHDSVQWFAVRAISSAGAHDGNTAGVSGRAQAAPPAAHTGVLTTIVEAD
jgi:hypothetical protein